MNRSTLILTSICFSTILGGTPLLKKIETVRAPLPIGPYSQAVATTGSALLFISGQIPFDAANPGQLLQDRAEATHQIMIYLKAILAEGNMDFSNVVKTTIYLTDMADFPVVNTAYGSYFEKGSVLPARETVAVKELPKNACVEISMIAVK